MRNWVLGTWEFSVQPLEFFAKYKTVPLKFCILKKKQQIQDKQRTYYVAQWSILILTGCFLFTLNWESPKNCCITGNDECTQTVYTFLISYTHSVYQRAQCPSERGLLSRCAVGKSMILTPLVLDCP